MHLNDTPFNGIKEETKTIELRLNDEKRQMLRVKDFIEITNRVTLEKILVEIIDLHYYSNFEELYKHFNKMEMGYDENEVANPKDMELYYSKEEQEKYGVVGIEMKLVNKN